MNTKLQELEVILITAGLDRMAYSEEIKGNVEIADICRDLSERLIEEYRRHLNEV